MKRTWNLLTTGMHITFSVLGAVTKIILAIVRRFIESELKRISVLSGKDLVQCIRQGCYLH